MKRDLPSDPLRLAASRWPHSPAIDGTGGSVTFEGLDRSVDRVCHVLAVHGVRPRTRVLSDILDVRLHATVLLAVLRLGAVALPVGVRLPPLARDELRVRFAPTVHIGDGSPLLDEVLEALEGPPATRVDPPAGARRRATVFLTSGTGGKPKAVVHRLEDHLVSAGRAAEHLDLRHGDRWIATLALNHVGGLAPVFRSLVAGVTWVVPAGPLSVGVLRDTRASHVSVVSTQLRRLLDAGPPPPESLRCVLLGGGPSDPDTIRRAVSAGWPIVSSYGMTETASMVTATRPGDPDPVTAGRPLDGVLIRIGADREILVRCPSLAEGYLEGGRVFGLVDRNGWYHTGDRGSMDGSGCIRVEGRLDRLFVSGGENVQPEEIERHLGSISGVREAVVVPVPDTEFGQRPVAFIDGEFDPEALRAELSRWLPSFLVPIRFLEMPVGKASGAIKISSAALQEHARRLMEAI